MLTTDATTRGIQLGARSTLRPSRSQLSLSARKSISLHCTTSTASIHQCALACSRPQFEPVGIIRLDRQHKAGYRQLYDTSPEDPPRFADLDTRTLSQAEAMLWPL